MSNTITDKYKAGKSSALSVADLERADFAGAANRSIADLAALAVSKPATLSEADVYWAKIAGSTSSLTDKSLAAASNAKTYSDVMFVPGT